MKASQKANNGCLPLNLASLPLSFPLSLSLFLSLLHYLPLLLFSQTDYFFSLSLCLSSLRHVRPLNFTILMSGQNPASLSVSNSGYKSVLVHKVLLYLRRQPPRRSFFLSFIRSLRPISFFSFFYFSKGVSGHSVDLPGLLIAQQVFV